jgi:hypothetical protein
MDRKANLGKNYGFILLYEKKSMDCDKDLGKD